jgi:hypothetical protein
MKEVFIKVQYIVCWAGCNLPFQDRCFDFFDEALEMYEANQDKLSLRIEEIATKTQIKIVWPENTRKVN